MMPLNLPARSTQNEQGINYTIDNDVAILAFLKTRIGWTNTRYNASCIDFVSMYFKDNKITTSFPINESPSRLTGYINQE